MPIELSEIPKKDKEFDKYLQIGQLKSHTVYQAISIFGSFALEGKPDALLKKEKSPMGKRLSDMAAHPENYEQSSVSMAHTVVEGRSKGSSIDAYSIKLEIGKATEIITLRAGKDFTDLSFVKASKLREVLIQQGDELRYEKFA